MDWERTRTDDGLTEWTRADGYATIRLRRRTDGRFAVRLDRLHQADEGRGYAFEIVDTRSAAEELVESWQNGADPNEESA
ncbi:DUF7543 family protein [Halohasta salina]|uniref:DUF7543 family protein n=1 Tax=Halohasta salina TaxID=2961621 RepID=UPI0020A4B4E7|nr:hypothetical protein [Halohasta salina]